MSTTENAPGASVQPVVRALCQTHPDVNYKTAWGCPECVRELREACNAAWNAFDNGKRKHHLDALTGKCIVGCQACAIEKLKRALRPNSRICETGKPKTNS